MDVFKDYATYYDLLYQDKDYQGEAEFIDSLLKEFSLKKPTTLLELGSGTGKHALFLAKAGYTLEAIDRSKTMLEIAGNLMAKAPLDITNRVKLQQGDVRTLCLDQQLDAAISLFHVLSYQTTNADLQAMFSTVKKHVFPGGLFIFDCWYGPAVLCIRPMVRYKTFKNEHLQVDRVAEPTLDVNENTVKVDYHLFIKEKEKSYIKLQETHVMRYLFLPELEQLCTQFGMTMLSHFEWMTRKPLSEQTWGACFVVKV